MNDRSMCGAILKNGSDCPAPAMQDAPVNLCRKHMERAYLWVQDQIDLLVGPTHWHGKARNGPWAPIGAMPGVVYYLAFADRVKIGTTTNLPMRLLDLPHDEVLAVEPGGHKLEKQRHRQFHAARVIGEWFDRTPELMAHIAQVKQEHGIPPTTRRVG